MKTEVTESSPIDIDALKRYDPDTVARWFSEYADRVYTFVYFRSGRQQDLAADVVQDVFLTALGKLNGYDPARGEMYVWLLTLARNCIRAALRGRGHGLCQFELVEKTDARLSECFAQLATQDLPDDVLERAETAELVMMTMAGIPGNYRDCLVRYYREDQSVREIAEESGLSESAVKSLLHRARLAFKAAFQGCGVTL